MSVVARAVPFVLSLFVVAAPLVVRADDAPGGLAHMGASDMKDESARAHFKAGNSLYESGRFPEAAEEFEQAYALSKRDALLYNVYVAYRDASNQPKAIDALQRYLATNDANPQQRLNLEARLRSMQSAQAAADEQKRASEAAAQANTAPAASEAPAPAPVTEPAPAPAKPPAVLPIVLLVGGGALVTAGVVTGLFTNSKVSEIEHDCPHNLCPNGYGLEDKRSSASTLATVTDIFWITGAVAAGVGVVLLVTSGGDTTEPAASASRTGLVPSLGCSANACAAAVRGAF